MTLSNWKVIAETRSYIFRWRSRFRRRGVCLSSLEALSELCFYWPVRPACSFCYCKDEGYCECCLMLYSHRPCLEKCLSLHIQCQCNWELIVTSAGLPLWWFFVPRLNPQPSPLRKSSEGSSSRAFCVLHVSVSFIFAKINRLLAVYCTYASSCLSSQRLNTLHLYGCKRIRNTSDLRLLNPALSIECWSAQYQRKDSPTVEISRLFKEPWYMQTYMRLRGGVLRQ